MAQNYSPRIVQDGLVMCLDPSQNKSYPTDLPVKNGLALWLDAADDTTFSYSSAAFVSQWRDKSGNNFHASQGTVASQPNRNTTQNSRKTVTFDGTNDTVTIPNFVCNSEMSIFVVSNCGNTLFIEQSTDSNSNDGFYIYGGGNGMFRIRRSSGSTFTRSTDWLSGGYSIATGTNSTGLDLLTYKNGTQQTFTSDSRSSLTNSYVTNTLYIGSRGASSVWSSGPIAEIIIYNRKVTNIERNSIHTYLGQKWGISNTDRSIIDLSGLDDNGLFGAGTTTYMPFFDYYNKGSLKFDGVDDYVDLGTNPSLVNLTNNITVEAWIKTSFPNNRYTIYGNNYAGTGMMFGTSANTPGGLEVYYPTIFVAYSTAGVLQPNVWQHVVYTRNGSGSNTHAFYINGVSQAVTQTANGGDSWGTSGTNRYLGLRSGVMFSGQMSTVRVYSRALTATEVAQNYEAQKARFTNTIVQQGLVLNLDAGNPYSYAGAGTTWYDVSGNGNHATLYNSPTWNSNGYFSLNGTNNYIKTTSTLNLSTYNAVTVLVIFKARSYPVSGNVKFICEFTTDFNSFQTGFVWTYNDTSLSQNYEVFTSIKGDVGYNIGVWNKNNYNDLNWEISTAVFDKSQTSAETSLYNQGALANVISNPFTGYTSNNTNNFGNDYLFIGCRGGANYFTDLDIASILVYNRALSAAEILQNYNATKGRFGL